MFVENVEDVGFGQNVRKRKSLVAREAGADGIQAGHGIAFVFTTISTALLKYDADGSLLRRKRLGVIPRPGGSRFFTGWALPVTMTSRRYLCIRRSVVRR